MATLFRLAGITEGSVDEQKREVIFRIQVEDGRLLEFVAPVPVIEQMASALGAFAAQVGQAPGQVVTVQDVAKYGIQRDAFDDYVMFQLVTRGGIPHKFAIPLDAIPDIVARLKTEGEKDRKPGHA